MHGVIVAVVVEDGDYAGIRGWEIVEGRVAGDCVEVGVSATGVFGDGFSIGEVFGIDASGGVVVIEVVRGVDLDGVGEGEVPGVVRERARFRVFGHCLFGII